LDLYRSNYVMYRALVMTSFRLFYPHQAILSAIFKWLHIIPSECSTAQYSTV